MRRSSAILLCQDKRRCLMLNFFFSITLFLPENTLRRLYYILDSQLFLLPQHVNYTENILAKPY